MNITKLLTDLGIPCMPYEPEPEPVIIDDASGLLLFFDEIPASSIEEAKAAYARIMAMRKFVSEAHKLKAHKNKRSK